MSQKDLSRRDFLKLSGVAAGTLAIAASGVASLPTIALADTTYVDPADMVVGQTYTASINLYVKKEDHEASLVSGNAYLTNSKNPLKLQGFPTSPVSDNATIAKNSDSSFTFTVPVVNEVFSLAKVGSSSDITVSSTATTTCSYMPSGDEYNQQRISSITGIVASQAAEYCFTSDVVEEYAAYPLKKGYHQWPVYMSIDFSTIH